MTLLFNQSDWNELCQQAPIPQLGNLALDGFEVEGVPERLGRGYSCQMELLSGLWVGWSDEQFYQDFEIKVPAHEHLVQCLVPLSGLRGISPLASNGATSLAVAFPHLTSHKMSDRNAWSK